MNFYFFAIVSFSIIIAAGIGVYRFKKLDADYHPFIFYTVLASLNELYSYFIVTRFGISNNANNNVYTLLEALIILWQFYRWDVFGKKKTVYIILQLAFIIMWLRDLYLYGDLFSLFHGYRIFYAVALTLMSLGAINKIIFSNIRSLKKNTRFLVSVGFITLYSFKIITELFWLHGLKYSDVFLYKVYAWFGYINLIINLLFILAVLWIPGKPRYINSTS